mgnify:CR=1 FL=1
MKIIKESENKDTEMGLKLKIIKNIKRETNKKRREMTARSLRLVTNREKITKDKELPYKV